MNKVISKFLLAGFITMAEVFKKQHGFTYGACGPFTKNKEKMWKFKETGDTYYIYKNELDKACFQHDMAYVDFQNLARRTASDKLLRDEAFNIAKYAKYDRYQSGLVSMVYKLFDKKSTSSSGAANNEIQQNLQLVEELHKPIIRNFMKRTGNSLFRI